MASLRMIGVSILAFLLLEPLILFEKNILNKPLLVVAADNSESVQSAGQKERYQKWYDQIESELSDKYELSFMRFGGSTENGKAESFAEKETSISSVFETVMQTYDDRSSGAVLLISDGIYNKGSNPYYQSKSLKLPVYSLALGDTTVRSDFLISSVRTNTLAYLGNEFPIVVDVSSRKCAAQPFTVEVFHKGKKVASSQGQINGNPYSASFPFMLKATETGTLSYQIRISNLKGEKTYLNNIRDCYIDVIDGRQKVLCLGHSPHPDLSVLGQAIRSFEQYSFELKTGEIPNLDYCKKFDLVILHNCASTQAEKVLADGLKSSRIPVWMFIGKQSNLNLFNQLQIGGVLKGQNGSFNQSLPSYNQSFSVFELNDNTKFSLASWPPLLSPFANFQVPSQDKILLYQKIGAIKSNEALWYLDDAEGYRTGITLGEGIWKWWLNDFEKSGNHAQVTEVIGKTVQYLSVKADKRKFRVQPEQRSYNENEPLVFNAEVYNDNYEAVNKGEVRMELKNSAGKAYPYTFSPKGSVYELNAGILSPDRYNWTAKTTISGKEVIQKGSIVVKPLQMEKMESVANHALLRQMSGATGGAVYKPGQFEQLIQKLKETDVSVATLSTEQVFKDLIHQKWLFWVIVLLLGMEWGMRKWNGAY